MRYTGSSNLQLWIYIISKHHGCLTAEDQFAAAFNDVVVASHGWQARVASIARIGHAVQSSFPQPSGAPDRVRNLIIVLSSVNGAGHVLD